MKVDYWSHFRNQRIARRRALAATGATATGFALLAACGGDDGAKSDKSGLIVDPVDTSKQAKRGGVLKVSHNGAASS